MTVSIFTFTVVVQGDKETALAAAQFVRDELLSPAFYEHQVNDQPIDVVSVAMVSAVKGDDAK